MKMKVKKFLAAAIPVIALIFPIVMTFLITVEPAAAQRSDRNLKQNITDVDLDEILGSLL